MSDLESSALKRSAMLNGLQKFKAEWEAGREPVTIPRAQLEAYRAAAKALEYIMEVITNDELIPESVSYMKLARKATVALRAAGIQTGE